MTCPGRCTIDRDFGDRHYRGEGRVRAGAPSQPDGHGVMVWHRGDRYEGQWQGGVRHGQGLLVRDGLQIGGLFERDALPRRGTLTAITRGCAEALPFYTGGLDAAGRPHGVGRYRYPGDGHYQGDFVHGLRHGQGTMRAPEATYTGAWRDDQPEDAVAGRIDYADGDTYVGGVRAGELRLAGGDRRIRGTFEDDRLPEAGHVIWRDGHTWTGGLQSGVPSGRGSFAYADGWQLSCLASRGEPPTRGTAGHPGPPAVVFTGALRDGRPHGRGTCTWPGTARRAEVSVDLRVTDWPGLLARADLAARVDALRDTAGNSLHGQVAVRLPCGHRDSAAHLARLQREHRAHLKQGKPTSAAMTLRCGIPSCRHPLDALAGPSGAGAYPADREAQAFLAALRASLGDEPVATAKVAQVRALCSYLEDRGIAIPAANAPAA